MDYSLVYKTAHTLGTHYFLVHSTNGECFEGSSGQNKNLVVPLPRRSLESGGHKLAVNRTTVAQHTLTSICQNYYSTDSFLSVEIRYPEIYNKTSKLQNNRSSI